MVLSINGHEIHHLSASQLNMMRNCPLQWSYYNRGKEREDYDSRWTDCGSAVHETLEAMANGKTPDRPVHLPPQQVRHHDKCLEAFFTMDIPLGGKSEVELETYVTTKRGERVLLKGRMDYIVDGVGYEYKSGSPRQNDYIQAAVYSRLMKDAGEVPGDVIFVYLGKGEMVPQPEPPENLVRAMIEQHLDTVRAGAFFPRRGSHCNFCRYQQRCSEDYQ